MIRYSTDCSIYEIQKSQIQKSNFEFQDRLDGNDFYMEKISKRILNSS